MSSSKRFDCEICEKQLSENDDTLTTDCRHIYHRHCAQKRLDEMQRSDCRKCGKESAVGDALARANKECNICEKIMNDDDALVTTDCQHTFHIHCAQKRLDELRRSECRKCGKKSALGDALEQLNAILEGECKICEKQLGRKDDTLTTDCQHIFHMNCAQNRLDDVKKSDCRECGKESAISNALKRYQVTSRKFVERVSNPTETKENVKPAEHEISRLKTRTTSSMSIDENTWECQQCWYEENIQSAQRCQSCGRPRCSPLTKSAMVAQEPDTDQTSSNNCYKSRPLEYTGGPPTTSTFVSSSSFNSDNYSTRSRQRERTSSRSRSPTKPPVTVYIKELPLIDQDDFGLANKIRHRIETIHKIKILDIRCYSSLGIGFIRVSDDQTKNHLVDTVGNMSLDSQVGSSSISFTNTLEIVSCIVLDMKNDKDLKSLPKSDEVMSRWKDIFINEKPLLCDGVSIQFPNIYRIITSFDESFVKIAHSNFAINGRFAQIYFGADYSYLEDLPTLINEKQLREAIGRMIGLENISQSILHIEFNKQAKNACIIACDIARKWSTKSFLYLDNKPISKKENLTYRLLVTPVTETYKIDSIINHEMFVHKATIDKHRGTKLILEISDKIVFDNCIKIGALRLNDETSLIMKNYIAGSDPEECEIDADTWYESEMLRYKPDIMQFIRNPEHEIFRFKWNSQLWLQQFKRLITQDQNVSKNINLRNFNGTSFDIIRHHLRVTVMLNTIAAIQKNKYIIDNDEIKLNLEKNLQTIIYNHQSKLKSDVKLPSSDSLWKKTEVKVFNEDCLAVYEQLVAEGKKPLLLNMASSTSPGGGYRKGDGAQEENIFRRSDYCRSLDVGLDEILEEPCERSLCTSQCKLDPSFDSQKMYPIHEYGAIYTSGLTVFRQAENTGYNYMKKPLHNVCSLAMAAYREPDLEEKTGKKILTPKFAVGMRKKIENIFSIAHHHKHNCLVLSALGCGAFRNPPDHVAKLFRSVIEQYAGFFELIIFAIIDDHNTGNNLNPQGNFTPFQRELHGLIVQPMLSLKQPNTNFGPYRLSSDGSSVKDICICDLSPCHFGAKCQDMYDPNHIQQFSHPPFCVQGLNHTCTQNDDMVHMSSFIHRHPCKYGAKCKEIDDQRHAQAFEHPSYCPKGGDCQDTTDDHEKTYQHLPKCEQSHRCSKFIARKKDHCTSFRHCKPRCPHGSYCVHFLNRTHIEDYTHPFRQPCPLTPYNCAVYNRFEMVKDSEQLSSEDHQHCFHFAHVCRFGRNCIKDDLDHQENFIHIPRLLCRYGSQCKKIAQEDHINSFTHPNIRDVRLLCKHGDACRDRQDRNHFARYRHSMKFGDSGVVRYCNLNGNIDFVQNQKNSASQINNYARNWTSLPSGSIPDEILDWIRVIQPVHRCRREIFESILLHGHVMGREYMEHLTKPKCVANSVLEHSKIRQIPNLKGIFDHVKNYVIALVTQHYINNESPDYNTTNGMFTQTSPNNNISVSSSVDTTRTILGYNLASRNVDMIREKTIEIAEASIKLSRTLAGIGYEQDKRLGTNKQVFSILGPHTGTYYGNVVIVFKRDILHHPDANFTTQAATSFASGKIYEYRPWLGPDPNTLEDRIDLFHKSKLHASIPGYEYTTALELIATTSHYFKKEKMGLKVSLEKILERWRKVDSHFVIETHLPQLIPLDYIEHIYMTEDIYTSLSTNARDTIDKFFKNCITIENKNDDEYNKFVVDKLVEKFSHSALDSISRPVQGIVMTIESTNLKDHYLLPLTISQAYAQYQIKHPKVSVNCKIYIYWQVMNGDMMLTLSNKQIDPNKIQNELRCLICYIAPKPILNDSTYHEQTSYLNSGHPFQHQTFIDRKIYAAKSTTFYVGCNTDDLMTFCLEIDRLNGMVTLSHAGPNSIYNHEKISCPFSKNVDLAVLEYIHVSAGAQALPIRNLIVCFEKQYDLHATFDEKFAKATTASTNKPTNEGQVSTVNTNNNASSSATTDNQTPKSSSLYTRFKNTAKAILFRDPNSKFKPCPDGIYCLTQFSENGLDHNEKYSHPCRFAHQCREPEENLTHEPHQVPDCPSDRNCEDLINPIHRSQFHHTGWPYFLIPCNNQCKCKNKSKNHLIKYSHGERVNEPKRIEESQAASTDQSPQNDQNFPKSNVDSKQQTQSKWGAQCRDITKPDHCKQFSHPTVTQQANGDRTPCKWNPNCTDHSGIHRSKFWHPQT
ncbi:unnamed protein product [Didymodactylos carnosus]|uniref:RING-type domain-containing protein n=1 Tax=Didymodactylos carnosus TaxID=1234261 RepID=A0A814QYT8_9BILA|nr:unnamed protein product [Didymodactylos carnosus]CAF3889604.1 unnamed protein product [Didymodactylos carnosus]